MTAPESRMRGARDSSLAHSSQAENLRSDAPPSAARPVAAHARHDHRTARPKFLHVMRVAHAHCVGTRIVARIDTFGLVVGRDVKPLRWTVQPARRTRILRRVLREFYF